MSKYYGVKSTYRIGVALALGIVIILGALYVKGNTPVTASTGTLIASAPERSYIESRDTDGDGIKDWEESLGDNLFKTIETPEGSDTADVAPLAYIPPTTFTGKFSEAFFKDYMQGKMEGQDFSDSSALVGNAVEAIDKNTVSKRHTRLELNIIPTSGEALREYGNEVPQIIAKYAVKSENATLILQKALTENSPAQLEQLKPIATSYQNALGDLLAMPVPEELIEEHIDLLNAYEATVTTLTSMQSAFTDPLYLLARMKGYEDDGKALASTFKLIGTTITSNGISYANDESGAFFYLFDI